MKRDNIDRVKTLIIEFIKIMEDSLSKEDLIMIINNFNTLNIKFKNYKITNFLFLDNTVGGYNPLNNTLMLDINNFESTIYHELFHVASSKNYLNKILISGFHLNKISLNNSKHTRSIGIGINEGYTQYLAEKYFSNKKYIMSAYRYQVNVAKLIEEIIGEYKMQSLYFHANLMGLINELSFYNDYDKVMEFLTQLDFLHRKLSYTNINLKEKNTIINIFCKVHVFLIETYLYKLLEEIKIYNLTEEQFNIKVLNFIEQIPIAVESKKVLYDEILTHELIEKTIERICITNDRKDVVKII
ncbi:MAG: hypothetical protein IKN63_00710 [Bacilli bacterium]|nr:hypothetical protein [Bacilli bacterium]